jgi:hypothetical protein
MLDAPCSEAVCSVLATHSIRQFPLHFSSRASPCAITFQLDSTGEFQQDALEACDIQQRGCFENSFQAFLMLNISMKN